MRFFKQKKVLIPSIIGSIIIVAVVFIVAKGRSNVSLLTDQVKRQDIKQTVLATGQVTSSTDLNLAFKGTGIVRSIKVKVGDVVKEGDVLANLDQRDQIASLTQARGSLASAQANYDKVVSGASSEEVRIAQTTLDNARKTYADVKAQQEVLVKNAFSAMMNSTPEAVPAPSNTNTGALVVSGSYTGTQAGTYTIHQEGFGFAVTGLESQGNISLSTNVQSPHKLGSRGLFVTFPSGLAVASDTWTVDVPNTRASNYVTNLNVYNAALQTQASALSTAQATIDSAQAQLDYKIAQARPADLAAARAGILSAEGQVQAASSALESTVIRAPANGTITSIDIKVGEQATSLKEAIILQDVGNLHVEANISEANIASIALSQKVSFTFDALGPDKIYDGQVQLIDPASTVVSGVVNYKVTASVAKVDEVKPGMTANMTILIAEKSNVLVVPLRAVLAHDAKKFVRVVTNPKKKLYEEKEVQTGLEADGGVVEILSGLQEGEEIVTFINQK